MRIVIDMQGAQTNSRFRGIGRYTLGLARGIARMKGVHEVFLLVNGSLQESVQNIQDTFTGILPPENIIFWYSPLPLRFFEEHGLEHQSIAKIIHSSAIADLKPDVVLLCSYLAEICDDFVCAPEILHTFSHVAMVTYDFIPYKDHRHLGGEDTPVYHRYMECFDLLRFTDLFLCISSYENTELRSVIPSGASKTIFCDTDTMFKQLSISLQEREDFLKKFTLTEKFILYSGGSDERKNIPILLAAHHNLTEEMRKQFPLVIIEGKNKGYYEEKYIQDPYIHFLGYISDTDLLYFYNLCTLFVFPSLEEGFGLPPLEAMRCGAAVIASNTTSLPEVIGLEEALFDPRDVLQLTKKLQQVLSDPAFHARLREHGQKQQQKFSWDRSARLCLEAMEKLPPHPQPKGNTENVLSAQDALMTLPLTEENREIACNYLKKSFPNKI